MKFNTENDGFIRNMVPVLLIAVVFIGLTLFMKSDQASAFMMAIRNWFILPHKAVILNLPWVNAMVFTTTGGLLIGIGVPRLGISTLAGMIFGITAGTSLGIIAAAIGASLDYSVARLFMAKQVTRLSGYRVDQLKKRFRHNAFLGTLYFRLFPLSNSTLVSLLAGACRIPFGPFLAGSVLGFIPLSFVMSFLGNGSTNGNLIQIFTGIACLIILHILLLVAKRKSKQLEIPIQEFENTGVL